MHTINKKTILLKGAYGIMKELKLDLLPGNLYAARKKAEQQKEKDKKNREHQKNVVKIEEVSLKVDKIDEVER
jgi:hypothetical protein